MAVIKNLYRTGNVKTTFDVMSVVMVGLFIMHTLHSCGSSTSSCNEAVCASIVSKCMLTQSCKCDSRNTSCSKDCFFCLDYLYSECCSCVEMCPKVNESDNFLSQKSHVEDLAEPFPDLFSVLTEEKDHLLRWTTYTLPTQTSFISMDKEVKFIAAKPGAGNGVSGSEIQVNCTVAYLSQCMSWNKCKSSCSSMGASSYRWFHDGCCECIGSTCINYGISESKCLECPPDKEIILEEKQVETNKIHKLEKTVKDEDDDGLEVIDKDDEPIEKMQNIDS